MRIFTIKDHPDHAARIEVLSDDTVIMVTSDGAFLMKAKPEDIINNPRFVEIKENS